MAKRKKIPRLFQEKKALCLKAMEKEMITKQKILHMIKLIYHISGLELFFGRPEKQDTDLSKMRKLEP